MLPSYPKVFSIGSEHIPNLFDTEVEITEKIDGSMFCFGCTSEGQIVMRSKGAEIFMESYQNMFELAVNFVIDHQEWLLAHPKMYFYGEFLSKPKHNVLCYNRIPLNSIILFGVFKEGEGFYKSYKELEQWAKALDLEPVPLLYYGVIPSKEELAKFLTTDSVLGGQKVEGIVVKNYDQTILIGGKVLPQFGKLVREEFKERHQKEWKRGTDKVQDFIDSFRTEARWQKAIQHLREQDELEGEPRDIGKLLKEIQKDLLEEEELNMKEGLLNLFKGQISRKAIAGFAEWYKDQLLNKAFEKGEK